MAADQDEFKTEIISHSNNSIIQEIARGSSSTSSKDDDDHHHIITHHRADIINKEYDNKDHDDIAHGGWLQLSLGTSSRPDEDDEQQHQISLVPRLAVELHLLPTASGSTTSSGGGETCSSPQPQMMMRLAAAPEHSFQVPDFWGPNIPITAASATTFFLQPQPADGARAIDSVHPTMTYFTHHHQQQQFDNMNLMAFIRPSYPTLTLSSAPSFPASILHQLPVGSQHGQQPPRHFNTRCGLDVNKSPMIRIDLRLVDPPPRPRSSCVWFILQASPNQAKPPYLPQLPKRYLRIWDGRATVRLLLKYLVNKLKLDSEFELEITCKGQQLLPLLTLQHVRDNIWNSRRNDVVFPHSASGPIDHLMVLNYGRIA